MDVQRLELEEFRCFHRLELAIPRAGLRLVGPNASGKTSILEALYLLATTRSFRTTSDRQLIHRDSGRALSLPPYARIAADIASATGPHSLEISLVLDPVTLATSKRYRRDGRAVRALDFVGTLRVVLFSPEDLELVHGPPQVRRRYVDVMLSTLDSTYLRALSRYTHLLEQRNSLLKQLASQDRSTVEEQLAFWDDQLVTYGSYLIAARLRLLATWTKALAAAFRLLTSRSLDLTIQYESTVPLPPAFRTDIEHLSLSEAQAVIALQYRSALERGRADELRRGVTLMGPHRDDFTWLLDSESLAAFGSRGLQRLAVIAAKLAEINTVFDVAGDWPVLLLDDALSELDVAHRHRLLTALDASPAQKLLTATDADALDHPTIRSLPLVVIEDGTLSIRD